MSHDCNGIGPGTLHKTTRRFNDPYRLSLTVLAAAMSASEAFPALLEVATALEVTAVEQDPDLERTQPEGA